METKMIKLTNDPCFGQQFQKIEQCQACWIKNACHTAFKNRK